MDVTDPRVSNRPTRCLFPCVFCIFYKTAENALARFRLRLHTLGACYKYCHSLTHLHNRCSIGPTARLQYITYLPQLKTREWKTRHQKAVSRGGKRGSKWQSCIVSGKCKHLYQLNRPTWMCNVCRQDGKETPQRARCSACFFWGGGVSGDPKRRRWYCCE